MRLVVETAPGVVELNWMWLPTWMGMDPLLKKEVETHVNAWLQEQSPPVKLDDAGLDAVHREVRMFIAKKFPKEPVGLLDYLAGLEHVQYGAQG